MTDHVATYVAEMRTAKYGGGMLAPVPYWSVTCSCDEWSESDQFSRFFAEESFQRHLNLMTLSVGLYECGCVPTRRPKRRCPMHGKPYVPKTPPKPKKGPAVSSDDILKALRFKHLGEKWALFAELRVATGYGRRQLDDVCDGNGNVIGRAWHAPSQKLIDLFAMNVWPSGGFERIAYEVKVSRSDFKNEIKKPYKRVPAMEISNRFYFATPPGLIKPEEVPEGCGLIEVHPETLHCRTVVKAPERNRDAEPKWGFVAALARYSVRSARAQDDNERQAAQHNE